MSWYHWAHQWKWRCNFHDITIQIECYHYYFANFRECFINSHIKSIRNHAVGRIECFVQWLFPSLSIKIVKYSQTSCHERCLNLLFMNVIPQQSNINASKCAFAYLDLRVLCSRSHTVWGVVMTTCGYFGGISLKHMIYRLTATIRLHHALSLLISAHKIYLLYRFYSKLTWTRVHTNPTTERRKINLIWCFAIVCT